MDIPRKKKAKALQKFKTDWHLTDFLPDLACKLEAEIKSCRDLYFLLILTQYYAMTLYLNILTSYYT